MHCFKPISYSVSNCHKTYLIHGFFLACYSKQPDGKVALVSIMSSRTHPVYSHQTVTKLEQDQLIKKGLKYLRHLKNISVRPLKHPI